MIDWRVCSHSAINNSFNCHSSCKSSRGILIKTKRAFKSRAQDSCLKEEFLLWIAINSYLHKYMSWRGCCHRKPVSECFIVKSCRHAYFVPHIRKDSCYAMVWYLHVICKAIYCEARYARNADLPVTVHLPHLERLVGALGDAATVGRQRVLDTIAVGARVN